MVRRKMMSLYVAAVAMAAVAQPVFADIYMHKDERGVVHFTNIPQGDKRFKLVRKEAGTPAYTAAAGMPQYVLPREEMIRRYSSMIDSVSRAHNVEPALVHAVISAESGYNPGAVSPVGARGLMQLMPGTASRFGVQNIMDPAQNIQGGVRYLRELLTLFNGNKELVVAAYNAGETAVIRHGNRIPPYAETVSYVPKVLGFYQKFQSRKG